MGPVVWVEGLIGSGKSTLTLQLASALNLRPLMEPVETNPYLELFYRDPKRWAFPMQIELLHRRYALQQLAAYEATSEGGYWGAVLDRGLPGDRVFCRQHVDAGNINLLEWGTYERAYEIMTATLRPPSLLLYLDVSVEVALSRVVKRARGCEVSVTSGYLESLHRGYETLLSEISSGRHGWSRGMTVVRVPWNQDDQPIAPVAALVTEAWAR